MLSYMERPQAFYPKAKSPTADYDLYDYMANDEKSDGLFTADKDLLNAAEVEQYRQYEIQSNAEGCPKYVQVVSFDNSFLEENHIMVNGVVDKGKLRSAFRKAMAALIEKEPKLDPANCYWTAAIHTNTDNIHIHSALCEYHRIEDRANKYRDKDMLSVEAMNRLKSKIANELIETNDRTKEHTRIERELLLPSLKKAFTNTTGQMLELRRILPPEGGWQYNRPKMKRYRAKIDAVVDNIINSNEELKNTFAAYKSTLDDLTEYYKEFYGEGRTDQHLLYAANTMNDFYARAGNSLLKALSSIPAEELTSEIAVDTQVLDFDDVVSDADIDYADLSITTENVKLDWNSQYKDAVNLLYGNKGKGIIQDIAAAKELLEQESASGNALAYMKLSYIFSRHLLGKADDDNSKADEYDKKTFNALLQFQQTGQYNQDYINYLLGKMYMKGQGCDVDNQKAFSSFLAAGNNKYALFSLGSCYKYGIGTEISKEKAASAYIKASEKQNPFAAYAAGECYEKGYGIESDSEKAYDEYKKALEAFIMLNNDMPSDDLQFKVGFMYLNGKGCDTDRAKAIEWLKIAADNKNDKAQYLLGREFIKDCDYAQAVKYLLQAIKNSNDAAEYTLGKLYLTQFPDDRAKLQDGIAFLENQARKDNADALYTLGRRYLSEKKNAEQGIDYLERAANMHDHEYAQYVLGTYYLNRSKFSSAERYLTMAADKDNSFAYYQLGRLYSIRGKTDLAAKCYRRSAELGNEFSNTQISKLYKKNPGSRKTIYRARYNRAAVTMRTATAILASLCAEQERHLKQLQQEFEEENNVVADYDYSINY